MAKAKPKSAKAGKSSGSGGVPGGAILTAVLAVAAAPSVALLFPRVASPASEEPPRLRREPLKPKVERSQQRSPPPSPPPSPAVPDPERCRPLAAAGQCAGQQAGVMQANCAAECDAWRGLSQIQRECAGYAEGGECGRNPAYMLTTCAAECAAWEAAKGLTIDRESRCVEWSLLGRCAPHTPRCWLARCWLARCWLARC